MAEQASYFMLEYSPEEDEAVLSGHPDADDPDIDWHCGQRFEKPPRTPVRLVIYEGDIGNGVLPELCDVPIPVMSRRLMKILQDAGVSNVEYYDAVIKDLEGGTEHVTHVAYNIVGAIAAADLERTRFWPGNPSRLIDADIEGAVIDPAKARGALLFRLAESVNGIVVHESVKKRIEAAGLHSLAFELPEDWIG
jgi:uncharacterized protein DUF1629